MGLLKKIGLIAAKATEILVGFGPIIKMGQPDSVDRVVDRVVQDSLAVTQIISEVEAIGAVLNLPGEQKLKAATPLVAQVVLQSSALIGRSIEQPDLFRQGCQAIASGWADVLNSLKARTTTINKA